MTAVLKRVRKSVHTMKIADKETFDLLERVSAKRCGALKQMNHKTEKF